MAGRGGVIAKGERSEMVGVVDVENRPCSPRGEFFRRSGHHDHGDRVSRSKSLDGRNTLFSRALPINVPTFSGALCVFLNRMQY